LISIYTNNQYIPNLRYLYESVLGWEPCPDLAWYLLQRLQAKIFFDFKEFARSQCDSRISFYSLHWAPHEGENSESVEQRLFADCRRLIDHSDMIFLHENEVHWNGMGFYGESKKFKHKRLKWIMPGYVDNLDGRIVMCNYHIWRIANLYREIPQTLASLTPHLPKPRYFDALLGTEKLHRKFVWDRAHVMNDKIITTMFPEHGRSGVDARNDPSSYICEPDFEFLEDHDYHGINQQVKYHGHYIPMSCIIPISVYNQTAYSIVAETGATNGIHMFTEKIAKPMIARRLFVVFAGRGYLRRLRQAGFRTFHDIIDESYDDVEDDIMRWSRAFDQVRYLCNQDQASILHAITPIVDHNHHRAMSPNLLADCVDDIMRFLKPLT
jgi:hypothetical protein